MAQVEIRVYEGLKKVASYDYDSKDRKGIREAVQREKAKRATSVIWVGTTMVYKKRS